MKLTKSDFSRVAPELKVVPIVPVWWNDHGSNVIIKEHSKGMGVPLIVGSDATSLGIHYSGAGHRWFVDWKVCHGPESNVSGRIVLQTDELESAFGISSESGIFGDDLLQSFGGDSAAPAKWIRWRDCLNIPCPGTGIDGDPNISINLLDNEIRNAVRRLIAQEGLPPVV